MANAASIESISAVTLAVRDMAPSVGFYSALGFRLLSGGESARFTTFEVGAGYLNVELRAEGLVRGGWGRVIFYVDDVDAMHARAAAAGLQPEFAPRDASWGERYFHMRDPNGHELSFARPLAGRSG